MVDQEAEALEYGFWARLAAEATAAIVKIPDDHPQHDHLCRATDQFRAVVHLEPIYDLPEEPVRLAEVRHLALVDA